MNGDQNESLFNLFDKAVICERRKFERFCIKLPVTIIIKNKNIAGYIHNISGGGICVKTYVQVPKNTEFELCFSLPENTFSHNIYGKVAWQKISNKFYKTGIKFTKITEKDRKTIINFNIKKGR